MRRGQFTFYDSFHKTIQNLRSNKAKLQAYQLICSYALTGELPYSLEEASPGAATVFMMAQPILDTGRVKAAAGKKGGSTPPAAS